MSMKIYNAQLSPYSARVRFAVYAKGLDAEIIDGFSTPELEAELEHLNPMAKVPTSCSTMWSCRNRKSSANIWKI